MASVRPAHEQLIPARYRFASNQPRCSRHHPVREQLLLLPLLLPAQPRVGLGLAPRTAWEGRWRHA